PIPAPSWISTARQACSRAGKAPTSSNLVTTRATRAETRGLVVGWAKRSVPTIFYLNVDGGHGASAPLPTLRIPDFQCGERQRPSIFARNDPFTSPAQTSV